MKSDDRRCLLSFPRCEYLRNDAATVGTPGRDGAEIVSQNIIDAWEVVVKAAEGLLMRRGGSGTPPRRGKGARKWTDGTY